MNKKMIEYVILAIAIILLLYGAYSFITYNYYEQELVLDSITLLSPQCSEYTVVGDTIEFKNPSYSIYNLNITKTDSSDEKVMNLINYQANLKKGDVEYLNESCYLVNVKLEDNGYEYHTLIIPIDSFDKEQLSFEKKTAVWVFDGNNEEFVRDSALNSRVVI